MDRQSVFEPSQPGHDLRMIDWALALVVAQRMPLLDAALGNWWA